MQEFLKDILLAVITTAVPVLTAYVVVLIRKVGENAAANTESVKAKTYIMEAAEAIAAAVPGSLTQRRRSRPRKRRWRPASSPSVRRRRGLLNPPMETSGNI